MAHSAHHFLQVDSCIVICIKEKCVDSIAPPEIFFGREVNLLGAENFNLFEHITDEGRVPIRSALPRWEAVVQAMALIVNALTLP